ncbi:MAG: hypothetical protein NUK62_08225 [Tenericutes bacterium]|nr:hypothetical protein [Mycoplasmatota bacterium]
MSTLDPFWIKPGKVSGRVLDPLGLDRTSDRIKSNLLTGIISLTERARYYTFYCWVLKNINENNFDKYSDFQNFFQDLARAYCLACISHSEIVSDNNHENIQGAIKGRRKWRDSSDPVKMQGFAHLGYRLGGYGYYYQASMRNLGLTETKPTRDVLTPLGLKIAENFEKAISKTKYFKGYINKKEIPKEILIDYGKKCCICLSPDSNSSEYELLRNILFNKISSLTGLLFHERRKQTLSLILYIVDTLGQESLTINEEAFLNNVYFRQYKYNSQVINHNFPDYLKDITEKWRFFRCHDFFSYGCETLLSYFLDTLDQHKHRLTGLSLSAFIDYIKKDILDILSVFLKKEFSHSHSIDLRDIHLSLLSLVLQRDVKEFNSQISKEFDRSCGLNSQINESTLSSVLEGINSKKSELTNPVANTILLFLTIYSRFYHKYKNNDSNWIWFKEKSKTDLSPYHLIKELDSKISQSEYSLIDYITWIYKRYIISWSTTVFEGKSSSLYAHPQAFFHSDKDVFRVDKLYTPRFRDSRFYSCSSILADLKLCKKSENHQSLTSEGKAFLAEIIK